MQIFPNGYLTYAVAAMPDLDGEGLPVASVPAEARVRCTITTMTDDLRGRYDDGMFRNVSFSVTLNTEDAPMSFSPTQVTLVHDHLGTLGPFQVQRVQYYDLTQTIELWV